MQGPLPMVTSNLTFVLEMNCNEEWAQNLLERYSLNKEIQKNPPNKRFSNMGKSWGRIRMWISIVMMPIRRPASGLTSNGKSDSDRHQNYDDPQHWEISG